MDPLPGMDQPRGSQQPAPNFGDKNPVFDRSALPYALGGIATAGYSHVALPAFVVFAISAIVAAPIFEELAFRGMLQRTLADRAAQGTAMIGQAATFAAYHLFPRLGWENIPYAVGLFCFGVTMGWLARRLGRLGAGCTAHCINNTLSVLVTAARR